MLLVANHCDVRGPRLLMCVVLFAAATTAAEKNRAQVGGIAPEPQWELWKINADGTGLARFADTPGYSCGSPQWSPDGRWVAYDTRRVEESLQASQVALLPADGKGPPRLIGPGAMPSWSPDGTHLVIHTYQPLAIVVMKADGTGRETIMDHFGSPRWMPGGNRIACIGRGGGISLFDLTNGREHSVLSGLLNVRPGFAVSPDGLRFAFAEYNGGLNLATLNPRTLRAAVQPLLRGNIYHASWSPDGRRIVYSIDNRDTSLPTTVQRRQLWWVDLETGDPPVWQFGQDRLRNNVNPAWSPDGKTIVFASQDPGDAP